MNARAVNRSEDSSERWNQLTEGAMRHLVDLNTIESEIAEILKPTKRDKEKTKGYKKNLRELIATFGEFRDSQLQKEAAKRKAEQSEKEDPIPFDDESLATICEQIHQRLPKIKKRAWTRKMWTRATSLAGKLFMPASVPDKE